MSLRQTEENCGLNPQGQREHLTASTHIYIVLHEQWTGRFRPPLTQQSMKHKEVAAGERAAPRSTQITSASSYRQCFVIQHEESHSWCITPGTWAALLQYVDDAQSNPDVLLLHPVLMLIAVVSALTLTSMHQKGKHLPEELILNYRINK